MIYDTGLHLINLQFTVIAPIKGLPFFHGPHWSAMFRLLRKALSTGTDQSSGMIMVHPIETGVCSYSVGDKIRLGVTVDASNASLLAAILEHFHDVSSEEFTGHFQPNVTVRLDSVISRRSGDVWNVSDPPITPKDLLEDAQRLTELDEFTIRTISPLRIVRPAGLKAVGHRYCDVDYFMNGSGSFPLASLLPTGNLRGANLNVVVKASGLKWIDVSYGVGKDSTTLGGIMGSIEFCGRVDIQTAIELVWGQYVGVGKNRSFGFGFYEIRELMPCSKVFPLKRCTTLFARSISMPSLKDALAKLPNSSPGVDGMTVTEAKDAEDYILTSLMQGVQEIPSSDSVSLKRYMLPKPNGGHRFIYVQNVKDRVLHRSFADNIYPAIENLLSTSAYAYRHGLSRKNAANAIKDLLQQGYTHGIKADISAFFDSVDIYDLCRLLVGLFPAEPLVSYLSHWLHLTTNQGISGLPQGWVLSPVLSNLYLDRFDRMLDKKGFKLVRFADDFVVLFRPESSDQETCLRVVEEGLGQLGLRLNHAKTQTIDGTQPINFLGYLVSASDVLSAEKQKLLPEEEWQSVFQPHILHGIPVYLSCICNGAYSSGANIILKNQDQEQISIPWSQVGRLVIVGRSPFSGGLVYRAVRERIPVTFLDVMGRMRGHLSESQFLSSSLNAFQEERLKDPAWQLNFCRALIGAKIHNSYVLLRRNDVTVPVLKTLEHQALEASNLEQLRGIEGYAARIFFEQFSTIVAPFEFKGRNYHPPDGPVNVMLSFGYTLLYNRITSVLINKEFNPLCGFFHVSRGRHCALASDILEPLRHIVERIVLALIHLKEIKVEDFTIQKQGDISICRMQGNGFRAFISRYEKTMASRFTTQANKKMSYNEWLDYTVDNLKSAVRHNLPYKPLRIS